MPDYFTAKKVLAERLKQRRSQPFVSIEAFDLPLEPTFYREVNQ